jgi:hypothetical protein
MTQIGRPLHGSRSLDKSVVDAVSMLCLSVIESTSVALLFKCARKHQVFAAVATDYGALVVYANSSGSGLRNMNLK